TLISGGFPCQDLSYAGRRAGIDGERSGLWREFARIILELRPRYALVENVPGLLSGGLSRVVGDLAEAGYDAEWTCLRAADAGAPQRRERHGNNGFGVPLGVAVRLWPTPRAEHDSGRHRGQPDTLHSAIKAVSARPTPKARDYRSASGNEYRNSLDLNVAALLYPTPTANRWNGLQSHGRNVVTGALNPDWVTQLQGFPDGWLEVEFPKKR